MDPILISTMYPSGITIPLYGSFFESFPYMKKFQIVDPEVSEKSLCGKYVTYH